jgi:AcrR family transcriptional regulator
MLPVKGVIMARSVNEEAYAEKRHAMLDAAQRLIYSKGYEQMTIQDVLDDVHLSRGAFHHYFDSKQALLEVLVERLGAEAIQLLLPIVQDQQLTALAKLQRYFAKANRWKIGQKAILLPLLRVWFADGNAIVRQKLRATAIREVAPHLAEIIRQGIEEGSMSVSYPYQRGEVMASLVNDAGEALGALLLSCEHERDAWQRVESALAAYTEAFERVLGVPAGSLTLADGQTMQEWLVSAGEQADGRSASAAHHVFLSA